MRRTVYFAIAKFPRRHFSGWMKSVAKGGLVSVNDGARRWISRLDFADVSELIGVSVTIFGNCCGNSKIAAGSTQGRAE